MKKTLFVSIMVLLLLLTACSASASKPEDKIIGEYKQSSYIGKEVYTFWKSDDGRYIGFHSLVSDGVEVSHMVFTYSIEGNEIIFDYGFGMVMEKKYTIENGNLVFLKDNGEKYSDGSGVFKKVS